MKSVALLLLSLVLLTACARSPKIQRVQALPSAAEFASQVEARPGLVVVDFWAAWCGPCRKLAPVLEDLAAEYEGRVAFYKVNVDEVPDLAEAFEVTSIPTIMLFRNGALRDLTTGRHPAQFYREWIEKERAAMLEGTSL